MNHLNLLPWWGDLLVILAILGVTTITAIRKKTATYYGFVGFLVVAPLTLFTWFTGLSTWWALPVIVITGVLFFVGLFRPDDKDNTWHFLALIFALSGKALIAGIIATWGMKIPLLVAFVLLFMIAALVVVVVRLMRSPRVEKAMSEKFDQKPAQTTDSAPVVDPTQPEPVPAN